jgi:hypothetical protein
MARARLPVGGGEFVQDAAIGLWTADEVEQPRDLCCPGLSSARQ